MTSLVPERIRDPSRTKGSFSADFDPEMESKVEAVPYVSRRRNPVSGIVLGPILASTTSGIFAPEFAPKIWSSFVGRFNVRKFSGQVGARLCPRMPL